MRPFWLPDGSITRDAYNAMVLQLDREDREAEQAIRMALERRTARTLRQRFDDMLSALYPEGYGEWADPNLEAGRIHRAFLEDQALRDELSRALQDGADLGVNVAVSQLEGIGYGFDWTMANVQARDWALRHTDEVLQQLANVSARGAGQAVGRWIDNGEPLEALIRDLSPVFGRARAERIAVTETTRAFAEGNREAYQASGVVEKWEWQTGNDELVCPVCQPLNKERRRIGEPFSHGGTEPPAHINCRCGVAPVVERP